MAWTEADLTALDAAIKEGVEEVRYKDKTVRYRSLKDMMELRNIIKAELGLTEENSNRKYFSVSKGVNGCD